MNSALTAASFGEANFGHCDLGDKRRTARLVKAADQILAHPDKTLPQKFASPKDYRALLRELPRQSETTLDGVVLDDHRPVGPEREARLGRPLARDRELAGVVLERAARRR